MITRLWRGWTTVDNADAYERFLLGDLFPSMRESPGFRGADNLRRLEHDEDAFIRLTRFDSLAAIKAFAGDDYETPVLEPQALALLAAGAVIASLLATPVFDGEHPHGFAEISATAIGLLGSTGVLLFVVLLLRPYELGFSVKAGVTYRALWEQAILDQPWVDLAL